VLEGLNYPHFLIIPASISRERRAGGGGKEGKGGKGEGSDGFLLHAIAGERRRKS